MLLDTSIAIGSIRPHSWTSTIGVCAVCGRTLFFSSDDISAGWKLTTAHGLDEFNVRGTEEAGERDIVASQALFTIWSTGEEIGTTAERLGAGSTSESCVERRGTFFGTIAGLTLEQFKSVGAADDEEDDEEK